MIRALSRLPAAEVGMRIRHLVSVTVTVTLLSAIALARTASAADRIRYVLFTADGTKGGEQVT
jgi:hypothetical protein